MAWFALAVLASAIAAALQPAAQAHDYHELSQLDPQLRQVLIRSLEDATNAETLSLPERTGVADPASIIETAIDDMDRQSRSRLVEHFREVSGLGEELDLPDNLLMTLFYDLADFARLYGGHGHGPAEDPAADADFERLRTLADKLRETDGQARP